MALEKQALPSHRKRKTFSRHQGRRAGECIALARPAIDWLATGFCRTSFRENGYQIGLGGYGRTRNERLQGASDE
ncbi:hypothetical protein ACFFQF_06730 [Haladaptatus pallidirubidus]|uniref:hypothetical protein n=1 Tax=Haladaptatus pallidirubidus TaxID=1008152 RepID=UPI0035E893CE